MTTSGPSLGGPGLGGPRVRDPRLDFFRGVAMLIIFIAHVPNNPWNEYIPARFGWSDATEMFVFCSGFAAAIAFGGTFAKAGFGYGTTRIGYRVWQIYVAHVAMFFFIAALVTAGSMALEGDYIEQLNLGWFLANPAEGLVGLFTLTYVPNYFDILPMYIGALVLIPVIVALSRIHPWAGITFSAALYAANSLYGWGLPAEPFSDREWFFNPLAWQLLFFTGFGLSMGWIAAPAISRPLLWLAGGFVVLSLPVAHWGTAQHFEVLRDLRESIWFWQEKTDFGLLRYAHFLALAYLAVALVKGREHRLLEAWARPIVTVGRNSLPIFLLSMGLARVGGMVLDELGRSVATLALVHLAGIAILIGFAYWCTLLKRQPWRKREAEHAARRAAERERAAARYQQAGVAPAE
ncbi:OpgC domain-containing protein [Thalassobaculum sp.]|uniref:OpgC family protein n=1 Tax=Thalassobaculum sp. TaxID=2022740 RepID=UPI0032EBD90E